MSDTAYRAMLHRGYLYQLQDLIRSAESNGVVLTITLEPQAPLTMGNVKMVPDVRDSLLTIRKEMTK